MANNGFKVKNKISLKTSTTAGDTAGDIRYDGSGNLQLRDGAAEKTILDQDNSVTVTNKTIDADNNTISNLAHGAEVDNPSSGVHGVTGSVVGTTDTQTLTNKTIDADLNTVSNIENADIKAGAAIDASKIADGSVSNAEFQYVNGVTSAIQTQIDGKISASSSDTLTNKTIDADNNTISNLAHGAEVDNPSSGVHGVTGSVVGTTDTQTLTNKTLTAPVIDVASLTEQGSSPSTPSSGTKKFYAKTDGKLYTLDSGGNEIEVGSGSGGGGVLYINEDFETGVTNLVAYADAAGTSPVDGTGGSPTVSVNAETSSQLIGTTSARIRKDAANRQGEGAAIVSDTVDTAYDDKVHTVEFLWKTDANYADGDMSLWVVHPTTGTVEALYFRDSTGTYTNELPASSSSTLRVVSELTPIDSTYRIVLHVASTSATLYDVYVDNIQCGPQKLIPGTIVTEWESFTPTGDWTTNTTYTGQYRRVGDSLEARIKVSLSGAPNSATLNVDIPSSLTIDTSKIAGDFDDHTLGLVSILDSGSAYFTGRAVYNSTTNVRIKYLDSTPSFQNVTQAAPMTFASGDEVYINFKVPISGWDAGAVLSSTQVDVQTPIVQAERNGDLTLNTSVTDIIFDTENIDTHSAYNTSTGVFTAPASGKYEVSVAMRIDTGVSAATQHFINIEVDGSTELTPVGSSDLAASKAYFYAFSHILDLTKGQTVEITGTSSTNASTIKGSNRSVLSIKKLPDYSTFAVAQPSTSRKAVTSKTTTYTATIADEYILADTSGGAWTLTLPTAVGNTGKEFVIKKTTSDFDALTIDGAGSETIDGSTTTTLNTENETLKIISDGSNWEIVERKIPSVKTAYTPTWSATTNTTGVTGFWTRVGDSIEIECYGEFNGANTDNVNLNFSLPSGLTIDTSKLTSTSNQHSLGDSTYFDSGTGGYVGPTVYGSTTTVIPRYIAVFGTPIYNTGYNPNSNTPTTVASGDSLKVTAKVPITGWNS